VPTGAIVGHGKIYLDLTGDEGLHLHLFHARQSSEARMSDHEHEALRLQQQHLSLDDKPALAKPMLQRATQNCSFPMTDPILATVGWYYLGRALEGSGDRDGARKAYERVQARWGKATPTSVTAAAAAARLANLATGSTGDPPSQDPR